MRKGVTNPHLEWCIDPRKKLKRILMKLIRAPHAHLQTAHCDYRTLASSICTLVYHSKLQHVTAHEGLEHVYHQGLPCKIINITSRLKVAA